MSEERRPDLTVDLDATAPLRTPEDIRAAVEGHGLLPLELIIDADWTAAGFQLPEWALPAWSPLWAGTLNWNVQASEGFRTIEKSKANGRTS